MMRTLVVTTCVTLFVLMAATPIGAVQTTAQSPPAGQPAAALVNLNSATQADLEKLPGVGPAMAKQIIEYRQKNGGFKKVEDILENACSCPCLLRKSVSDVVHAVARTRRNAQQISQRLMSGGRSGGRTCFRPHV